MTYLFSSKDITVTDCTDGSLLPFLLYRNFKNPSLFLRQWLSPATQPCVLTPHRQNPADVHDPKPDPSECHSYKLFMHRLLRHYNVYVTNGHVQCSVPETVSLKVACSVRHRACPRHEWRYCTVANFVSLGPNWWPHGTRKELLGTRHSLFCLFSILLLSDQRHYTVHNMCIYTHIWLHRDCVWVTVVTK